jgi:hypothetical protein
VRLRRVARPPAGPARSARRRTSILSEAGATPKGIRGGGEMTQKQPTANVHSVSASPHCPLRHVGGRNSAYCTLRSTPPDAIARDSLLAAGFLARGSSPPATFPGPHRSQWFFGRRLAADSCGGSYGFVQRMTRKNHAHERSQKTMTAHRLMGRTVFP